MMMMMMWATSCPEIMARFASLRRNRGDGAINAERIMVGSSGQLRVIVGPVDSPPASNSDD